MARRSLTIDNEVAAELAGSGDSVLRTLEERLDCDVYLRGNVITLDGEPGSVSEGQDLVEELVGLIERGHEIDPGTIGAVDGAAEADLIAGYLPEQISDQDLAALIDDAIAATGASTQKDMGKVIGVVMGLSLIHI